MNKKQYNSPKTIVMAMHLGNMIAVSLNKYETDPTEETIGGSDALSRGGWNSTDWSDVDED